MKMRFKSGDQVQFISEVGGNIWEVIECDNLDEVEAATDLDLISLRIIPRYWCTTIEYGKVVKNRIAENLLQLSKI